MNFKEIKHLKCLSCGLGRNKHLITISLSCYLLSVGFKRAERHNINVSLIAGIVNLC